MKKFLIGIIIGMLIAAPIAYAAGRMVWVNGSGNEVGTESNPLYIESV
jgi:hypothetical protein